MTTKYVDVSELSRLQVRDFSVVHSNLNGAKSHLNDLCDILDLCTNKFTVIGVSETRLRTEEEMFFEIGIHLSFVHALCPLAAALVSL